MVIIMRVLYIYNTYNIDYHPVINITMGIPEVLKKGTSSVNGRCSIFPGLIMTMGNTTVKFVVQKLWMMISWEKNDWGYLWRLRKGDGGGFRRIAGFCLPQICGGCVIFKQNKTTHLTSNKTANYLWGLEYLRSIWGYHEIRMEKTTTIRF